ncbi:hypothetical protein NKG94_22015 [Micromonospora sp. M12]
MGGQNGALQWNRASDDATLPEQSPAGVAQSVPLPTNRWVCLEFMVDGSAGQLRTWLDGTAVTGLTADGSPTHDIDGQWYNRTWRPQLTDLKLGWESYGGVPTPSGTTTSPSGPAGSAADPARSPTLTSCRGQWGGPAAVPLLVISAAPPSGRCHSRGSGPRAVGQPS